MKNLILKSVGNYAIGMIVIFVVIFASCKKEVDTSENIGNGAFQKTIKVYDASKLNSMTLNVSSNNENEIRLINNTSFSIVPVSSSENEAFIENNVTDNIENTTPDLVIDIVDISKQPDVNGLKLIQNISTDLKSISASCNTNYNVRVYSSVASKPKVYAKSCLVMVRFGTKYKNNNPTWGTSWGYISPYKSLQSVQCWGDNFNYKAAIDIKTTGSGYYAYEFIFPCW